MTDSLRRHLLILGSTGSIGRQALEVLPAVPDMELVGLAAGSDVGLLLEQAEAHDVGHLCLHEPRAAAEASTRCPERQVLAGDAGVRDLITSAAERAAVAGVSLTVLNGIVGAAGLRATMATLEVGATLALANKESMVAGGPFVLEAARQSGSLILPVDSEHSALFQCISAGRGTVGGKAATDSSSGGAREGAAAAPVASGFAGNGQAGAPSVVGPAPALEELLLTGSGGPFRGRKAADLLTVTVKQALAHPNWAMGPKISIDSATLMNKGLELIEAHYLFGVPYENITVVIDPRSAVHSMARFSDGAVIAHLGVPDMRTPIGWALAYPERPPLPQVRRLDIFATQIAFEPPDTTTFRCLALAEEAGRKAAIVECQVREAALAAGAQTSATAVAACRPRTVAAPIVLNAANEVAVETFLAGRLHFLGIPEVVEKCLTWLGDEVVESLDDVYECDAEARRFANEAAGRPG